METKAYSRYVSNMTIKAPSPFTGISVTETKTGYSIHELKTTSKNALYGRNPISDKTAHITVAGWDEMSPEQRQAHIDEVFEPIRCNLREE